MNVVAWITVSLGALFSIYLLQNDFRAARATEPYEGKKFGPELHVIAGLLTGVGSGLLLGLWPGVAIGVGHAVMAFVVALVIYRM